MPPPSPPNRFANSRRFMQHRQNSMEALSWMVLPPAAPVTLPKLELVTLVVGLLQRTKLKGFCASARTSARTFSVIGMRLASESDSLFPEKPRTQSSTLAVFPSWNVVGDANAARFKYVLVAGSNSRGLVAR